MPDLRGKNALVIGGTGGVGEGVVKSFLRFGATTIVPVRNQSKVKYLSEYVADVCEDRLITIESDLSTEAGWKRVQDTINWRYKTLDIVVASIGGWWQGEALHRVSEQEWASVLNNNLTAHYRAGKYFLSHLLDQRQGLYVMINGAASHIPVPGSGAVSVVAAAQRMMTKVFARENKDNPVRIHSLVINTAVTTRKQPAGNPGQITAEQVGDYIIQLATGGVGGDPQVEHHLPLKPGE